jgi:hypothetical protein
VRAALSKKVSSRRLFRSGCGLGLRIGARPGWARHILAVPEFTGHRALCSVSVFRMRPVAQYVRSRRVFPWTSSYTHHIQGVQGVRRRIYSYSRIMAVGTVCFEGTLT